MTRVDHLQERYPSIPRDIILKYDVMVQGIRDSDDLDKVSDWTSVMQSFAYQSSHYDGSLQELAHKMPWKVRHGSMLRPPRHMRFKSGLGADLRLRSTSPYTITEVSQDKFGLYEGEERVEDIYFLRHKLRATPEPVTSKGTPISTLMVFQPCCFRLAITHYCEYFSKGQQCKFCNYNATQEDARSVGVRVPTINNLEETIEAYKIRSSEVRQLEGQILMGGFAKPEQEAKIFLTFVERMASATPHETNFGVKGQAMDRKNLQRLRDAGSGSFTIQIEVMDPQLFAEICPGKVKYTPYEGWIQAFYDAVDIFGVGNVGGKLVPGVSLLSPNGYKTWQEARDAEIAGIRWLIENGIFPCFKPLWYAPGSVYADDKSYMERFPPTEYHLEVGLAHHEAMLRYGLYDKMNKFIWCGLDTTCSAYVGDIGMLALAGDVGEWMSDVVPDELNWLAKFIASVKPPVTTQPDGMS